MGNEEDGVVESAAVELYLDLLKRVLTRTLFEHDLSFDRNEGTKVEWDRAARAEGRDWPAEAETMVGLKRLDNIQRCLTDVVRNGVPGDVIETGVWRGGASIFGRAVLKALGDEERTVWVADSFQGLPKPDPERFPVDRKDRHHEFPFLAVSEAEVRANFERYGMLDERVRFLVGWFQETLPAAPIERLAVLRLDGDMYESTMVALDALYPKLSPGGYVIVDDYGALRRCRRAIDDYRRSHGITEPIETVDWTGVYWRKTA